LSKGARRVYPLEEGEGKGGCLRNVQCKCSFCSELKRLVGLIWKC
jgi:radical SAM superfamily enzyme with C-terminal helix-hairpin-helix motif